MELIGPYNTIKMYDNNIHQNKLKGIEIVEADVDMGKTILAIAGNYFNSNLTGYNFISSNGTEDCESDREEIEFHGGNLFLSNGCNEISDNRHNHGFGCMHEILIDGTANELIRAEGNYWGVRSYYGNSPEGRFSGGVEINYEPFLTEPCLPQPGQSTLMLTSGSNYSYDSLILSPADVTSLSNIELTAALADGAFLQGLYQDSKSYYNQLLTLTPDDQQAYIKLFQIAHLTGASIEDFSNLRSYYENQLPLITDNEVYTIVEELISFCFIAEEDYETAIDRFFELVNNYPGTMRAFSAELNILATSLLIGGNGFQKTGLITAKSLGEYNGKLKLIMSKYGMINDSSLLAGVPQKFSLENNFPNPFNPVTQIKFNIPERSFVELTVYNILGQKVAILKNEIIDAGSYTVPFDASNLPSGVYVYNLFAQPFGQKSNFNKSAKMMLLK